MKRCIMLVTLVLLSLCTSAATAAAAAGEGCVHGAYEDSECVCDPFYAGEDCSIACPGVLTSGCSDRGCYGQSAATCGEACDYRGSDGACLGRQSCVASVCSNRGECDWGRGGTGRCVRCDEGYHGPECATLCTVAGCQAAHGIPGMVCDEADGSCGCPDSDDRGHFSSVAALCRECREGWYGVACRERCPCGGHGTCGQVSGACRCYDDDERGHWAGVDCGECLEGFIGESCARPHAIMPRLATARISPFMGGNGAAPVAAGISFAMEAVTRSFALARGSTAACGVASAERSATSIHVVGDPVTFPGLTVWAAAATTTGAVHLLLANDTGAEGWHVVVVQEDIIGLGRVTSPGDVEPNCGFSTLSDTVVVPAAPSERIASALILSGTTGEWLLVTTHGAVVWPDGSRVVVPGIAATGGVGGTLVRARVAEWSAISGSVRLALLRLDGAHGWRALSVTVSPDPLMPPTVEELVSSSSGSPALAGRGAAVDLVVIDATHVALALSTAGSGNGGSGSSSSSGGATATATVALVGPSSAVGGAPFAVEATAALPAAAAAVGPALSLSWYAAQSLLFVSAAGDAGAVLIGFERVSGADDTAVELRHVRTRDLGSDATAEVAGLVPESAWGVLYAALWAPAAPAMTLTSLVTYAVTGVDPGTVAIGGGESITVRGAYFPPLVACLFDGETATAATTVNASAIICPTPGFTGASVCSRMAVTVTAAAAPFPAAAPSTASLARYPTPHVSAASAGAGDYSPMVGRSPVRLSGQGFVDLAAALGCRFEDAAGMSVEGSATYASSETVYCAAPAGVDRPTRGKTGTVALTYGGVVFSNRVPFTFVGPAAGLRVASPATPIVVQASRLVELPRLRVDVVDAEDHPLRELDADEGRDLVDATPGARVVVVSATWFNSTRAEVSRAVDPYESLILLAAANQTRAGTTTLVASLQYPLVGVGQLRFSSQGLAPALVLYTVVEGLPRQIAVAVQPTDSISEREATRSRQPVASFLDDAGNTVRNASSTAAIVVTASFYNATGRSQAVARPVAEGYVPFYSVFQRGNFGQRYAVHFAADGLMPAVSHVMGVALCDAGEYGRYGSTDCLACPAHARCNGSHAFNETPGHWKAGDLAYTVYTCDSPRACLGGSCREGYRGLLCARCAPGFGKTATMCVGCFSVAVNVVLLVLLVVAVLLAVFGTVVVLFQALGKHTDAVALVRMCIDYTQVAGLILHPLPEMPAFVEHFAAALRAIFRCDAVQLSPLSCLFNLNAQTAFIVATGSTLVVCLVVHGVLMYTHSVYERYLRRVNRQRRFNRSLAPFKSTEDYFSRIAALGLDEEPSLSAGVPATLGDLEEQTQNIRSAYALLEKNGHAVATISQMPPSKPRETTLRALLEEQDQLHEFLERYEAQVSMAGGPGASPPPQPPRKAGSSSAVAHSTVVAAVGPAASGNDRTAAAAAAYLEAAGSSNSIALLPPAAHGTDSDRGDGDSNGDDDDGDDDKDDVDSVDSSFASRGTTTTAAAAAAAGRMPRFLPVTGTRLSLFGVNEPPFQPIRANLDSLSHHLTVAKEPANAPPQRRGPVVLEWPSPYRHVLLPPFIIFGYLYVFVIYYCFALVPCRSVALGASPSMNVRPVLRADVSVSCDSPSQHRYRTAGIIIGSLIGGGYPLLLALYIVLGRAATTDGAQEAFFQIVTCVMGLRPSHAWWELTPHLLKLLAVLLFALLPSPHMACFIVFWALTLLLVLSLSFAPRRALVTRRAEIFCYGALMLVSAVQLLPYAYQPGGGSYDGTDTINVLSGVLTVVFVCLGAAALAVTGGFLMFASAARRAALTERWETVVRTVTCGPIAVRYANITRADCARLPFSFESANAVVVDLEARRAMEKITARRRMGLSGGGTDADASVGQRPTRVMPLGSGAYGILPSTFRSGRMTTARTTDLLLDFVETNSVELDGRTRGGGAAPSMVDMEREVQEVHSIVVEHAQQLDRLIQLLNKSLERQREHS